MPRTIVYDTVSRAILAVAPADDPTADLPLPEGLASAVRLTLTTAQATKLAAAAARFTVNTDGTTVDVETVVLPPDPVVYTAAARAADVRTLLQGPFLQAATAGERLAFVRLANSGSVPEGAGGDGGD